MRGAEMIPLAIAREAAKLWPAIYGVRCSSVPLARVRPELILELIVTSLFVSGGVHRERTRI